MSPRAAVLAVSSILMAASAAASGVSAGPPAGPDDAAVTASLAWGGRTGQSMVTRSRDVGLRPSRASSREAMAAAAGQQVQPPTSRQAREANAGIAELAASAELAAKELAKDAWQLPIPRGVYRITAEFGECSALWANCHTGLDFAAPSGTPIRSVAAGVVTQAGWAGPYGNRTVVTLRDGTEIWYCHQLDIGVRAGDNVFAGQVIGRVGATGNVTGPHLHLEVRPGAGDAVDPYEALAFRGATP